MRRAAASLAPQHQRAKGDASPFSALLSSASRDSLTYVARVAAEPQKMPYNKLKPCQPPVAH
eukprot:1186500-Pleurochrysis_carterae.AAC.1